jgi:hypothetical protein
MAVCPLWLIQKSWGIESEMGNYWLVTQESQIEGQTTRILSEKYIKTSVKTYQ